MQLGALLRRGGLLSHLRVSGDAAVAVLRGSATAPSHACFAARAAAAPGESPDDADLDLTGYRAPQGWWADPAVATARQALDIFDAALERHRHLRQRHVQEIIKRCRDGDDISLAVQALQKLRRFRAAEEVHAPFNNNTCKLLVQRACSVGAPEVVAEAFDRFGELGLKPTKIQVNMLLASLGKRGNFGSIAKLLDAARRSGLAPTSDMAYCLARAAHTSGQYAQGRRLLQEMELNGVRVRDSTWRFVDEQQQASFASKAAGSKDAGIDGASPPGSGEAPAGAGATSSAADDEAEARPPSDAAAEADAGTEGDGAAPEQDPESATAEGTGASAATGVQPGVAS